MIYYMLWYQPHMNVFSVLRVEQFIALMSGFTRLQPLLHYLTPKAKYSITPPQAFLNFSIRSEPLK
jgi:hypothetical protein